MGDGGPDDVHAGCRGEPGQRSPVRLLAGREGEHLRGVGYDRVARPGEHGVELDVGAERRRDQCGPPVCVLAGQRQPHLRGLVHGHVARAQGSDRDRWLGRVWRNDLGGGSCRESRRRRSIPVLARGGRSRLRGVVPERLERPHEHGMESCLRARCWGDPELTPVRVLAGRGRCDLGIVVARRLEWPDNASGTQHGSRANRTGRPDELQSFPAPVPALERAVRRHAPARLTDDQRQRGRPLPADHRRRRWAWSARSSRSTSRC